LILQLLFHWIGDYLLQSDWMALNKTKKDIPCYIHCFLYTLPFWLLTSEGWNTWLLGSLSFIFWSHFIIDRFSLVKYLIYFKNHINPSFSYKPWKYCNTTGYFDNLKQLPIIGYADIRPGYITIWLYIITDNGLHLICNYLALKYL